MYEELQLKTMPKPPKPIKSILADGFVNKLFGIVSPSKLFMIYATVLYIFASFCHISRSTPSPKVWSIITLRLKKPI